MARALAHQELLNRILTSEARALDGLPAAQRDLWRLAHVAIHLRGGMVNLRRSAARVDVNSAEDLAARLRRCFRKALIAYARRALRTQGLKGRLVLPASGAALAEIGPRSAAGAERLADLEAGGTGESNVLRDDVVKPLLDPALDWQRAGPETK